MSGTQLWRRGHPPSQTGALVPLEISAELCVSHPVPCAPSQITAASLVTSHRYLPALKTFHLAPSLTYLPALSLFPFSPSICSASPLSPSRGEGLLSWWPLRAPPSSTPSRQTDPRQYHPPLQPLPPKRTLPLQRRKLRASSASNFFTHRPLLRAAIFFRMSSYAQPQVTSKVQRP